MFVCQQTAVAVIVTFSISCVTLLGVLELSCCCTRRISKFVISVCSLKNTQNIYINAA